MTSTTFINQVTRTDAGWFNDVNDWVYEGVVPTGATSASINSVLTTDGSGVIAWSTTLPSGILAAIVVAQSQVTNLVTDLAAKQPLDATLTALAAYSTNGLLTQTASDTFTGRTLTAPAAGITVTNGNGVAGNPTLALADDLAGLEGLSSTGMAVRTAASTWTVRTITAGSAKISVTNGSGVSGNPTIDVGTLAESDITNLVSDLASKQTLDATLTSLAAYNTNGLLTQTAADTFTGRTITGTADKIDVTNGNGVAGNPTVTISATYAGQNTITTVGTIATGVWNGTAIAAGTYLSGQVPLANGGTAANLTDPNADRIMFWDDSAGQVTWLTAGAGLSITDTTIAATGATLADADYGDITVSSSGTVMAIDNDAVTFAKMQNINTDTLLGRESASSGNVEEISIGANLTLASTTLSAASGLIGKQIKTAGSGTYTPTTGMGHIIVYAVAGGGGSAGVDASSSSQDDVSGGSGAGAWCIAYYTAADIGASKVYSVGTGGSGGPNTGGGGNAGGATTFGTAGALFSLNGGALGARLGSSANTTGYRADGGAGGTVATAPGDGTSGNGAKGDDGMANGSFCGFGGAGAGTMFGTGGGMAVTGASSVRNGNNGIAFGSGGSGAAAIGSTTGATGGNGADGIMIIYEFS